MFTVCVRSAQWVRILNLEILIISSSIILIIKQIMTAPTESFTPAFNLSAQEKEKNLRSLMRDLGKVLVAYSGGVDSSYLAFVASRELNDNAFCVMGISPSVSALQKKEAENFAKNFGLNYFPVLTDEMNNPNYNSNPSNRCYFCKSELYGKLKSFAVQNGVDFILDGSNADDVSDYRPGRKAAAEKNVRSLLFEVGLTKNEIRELSKYHGLPTWDKPANPCLSSRIAYGIPVSIERLSRVERSEAFLRELGFNEFRVRNHDELARIE